MKRKKVSGKWDVSFDYRYAYSILIPMLTYTDDDDDVVLEDALLSPYFSLHVKVMPRHTCTLKLGFSFFISP